MNGRQRLLGDARSEQRRSIAFEHPRVFDAESLELNRAHRRVFLDYLDSDKISVGMSPARTSDEESLAGADFNF